MITAEFNEDVASQAGFAHESLFSGSVDTTQRVFGTSAEADEVVDLLNNEIGRRIGQTSAGAGGSELAGAVLDEFHNNGLWVGHEQQDGTFKIEMQKLADDKYHQLKSAFQFKDDNGRWINAAPGDP